MGMVLPRPPRAANGGRATPSPIPAGRMEGSGEVVLMLVVIVVVVVVVVVVVNFSGPAGNEGMEGSPMGECAEGRDGSGQ